MSLEHLKKRLVVVVAVLLPLSAMAGESEWWSVHLKVQSNWGSTETIHITSEGTIAVNKKMDAVAFQTAWNEQDIDEMAEVVRTASKMHTCQYLELDEADIQKYADLITKTDDKIPNRSKLRLNDNCDDEPEYFLTLKTTDTERQFHYTAEPMCQGKTDVPLWLENLVKPLLKRYQEVNDCK